MKLSFLVSLKKLSFNSIHKDCRSIDLIHSRANVGTSIHQPIYNDVHEKEINAESQSQSGNEINKNNKDWNEQRFGLAEYSDTVGPPGERFFCYHLYQKTFIV